MSVPREHNSRMHQHGNFISTLGCTSYFRSPRCQCPGDTSSWSQSTASAATHAHATWARYVCLELRPPLTAGFCMLRLAGMKFVRPCQDNNAKIRAKMPTRESSFRFGCLSRVRGRRGTIDFVAALLCWLAASAAPIGGCGTRGS